MKPIREVLEEHCQQTHLAKDAAETLRAAASTASRAAHTWERSEEKVKKALGRHWAKFFLTAFLGGFAGGGLVLLYFLLLR